VFLGVAGLVLALIGVQDPVNANPMAFLLGLVWIGVVSTRFAVRPQSGSVSRDDAQTFRDEPRVTVAARRART
jgi:hypothetical protein